MVGEVAERDSLLNVDIEMEFETWKTHSKLLVRSRVGYLVTCKESDSIVTPVTFECEFDL